MKGIAHFTVGVAAASFFPIAVSAGADGNAVYFVLGGAAGLLPDTLDFKFYRFFYKHDIEVVSDPLNPDPGVIANAVAEAVHRCLESGKNVRIKLNTIRVGADTWRKYTLKFDVANRKVVAEMGPEVDTSGAPVNPRVSGKEKKASASLACDIRLDYMSAVSVDIFEGPVFEMVPEKDGMVRPRFIPWHREWSHSFVIGFLFSLIAAVALDIYAGMIVFTAWAAHILFDQLGFMGSNVLYPFKKHRVPGMKKAHAVDILPNFMTVWISCMVIFWNLHSACYGDTRYLNPLRMTFYGVVLPFLILFLWRRVSLKSDKA